MKVSMLSRFEDDDDWPDRPRVSGTKIIATDLLQEFYDKQQKGGNSRKGSLTEFGMAAPPLSEFWFEGNVPLDGTDHGRAIRRMKVATGSQVTVWDLDVQLGCGSAQEERAVWICLALYKKMNDGMNIVRHPLSSILKKHLPVEGSRLLRLYKYAAEHGIDGKKTFALLKKERARPFGDIRWVVTQCVYSCARGVAPEFMGATVFYVDRGGGVSEEETYQCCARQMGKGMNSLFDFSEADALELIFNEMFSTCFLISLLNCKNVVLRDTETAIPKSRDKKRKKRIIFKELVVQTPGVAVRRLGDKAPSDGEVLTRQHICRGHFADYREGNGLFGKHNGMFWISPHVRGSTRFGAVIKDYKLIDGGRGVVGGVL